MIPLALAAILEDDEEAIQVHEVWALDLSSLNSFFFSVILKCKPT